MWDARESRASRTCVACAGHWRDSHPDLIHSNGFKMHVLAAWARPAGCPLIWHIRDYVSARPLMSRLIRANANRCTAAIANSNSVAEDLRRVCGDKLRIHRVYNGVDLNAFSPRGEIANLDEMCAMPQAAAEHDQSGFARDDGALEGSRGFSAGGCEGVTRDADPRIRDRSADL